MIVAYLSGSILIAGALFRNKNRNINRILVFAFLILQWAFTWFELNHKDIVEFSFFLPDALALLLLVTLSIISVPALMHTYDYIYKEKDNPHTRGIYYGAMVLLIMALSAAYLSSHVAVTWIFVEITTLSASALIFHRRNAGSIEATWKYVFVCSISLVFVFIGILFLSIALGKDHEEGMLYYNLIDLAPELNPFWLKMAFIFIFTGYTAKLGLVPMYTAGIDAKDKAPTPAAALFSSVLMNVGFVGMFRFYLVVANTGIHAWVNNVILIAAFLSIFVATVYMLKVKNIKRMLAYSSIEHMGLIMLGIVAGGIGYYAAILHLILHAFAKSALFFQIGHLYKTFRTKNIYAIGNYFKYNVGGAVFLLIAFVIITAMPPSGLFVSEFFIFKALFEGGYLYVLIPVLLLLTLIIWALGKNILKMVFIPPVKIDESQIESVNPLETWSQYLLIALVIYLGLNPPTVFVEFIQEAVKTLTL
jgi:hydrogenase-4 component F